MVADALRDRGAVVGLGLVGDFTDVDRGERGFGYPWARRKRSPLARSAVSGSFAAGNEGAATENGQRQTARSDCPFCGRNWGWG